MAALTKASFILQASASNSAGASTTSNSLAMSTSWAGFITGLITNGTTPPSQACQMIVQSSNDGGTTWKNIRTLTATGVPSGSTSMTYEVPDAVQMVRVFFSGNTVQAVTVEAQITYVTNFA